MNRRRIIPFVILALMAATAMLIRHFNQSPPPTKPVVDVEVTMPDSATTGKVTDNKQPQTEGHITNKRIKLAIRGLNRNPSRINYSKHARCRMECRHISEQEVQQILKDGAINYVKSDLTDKRDCNRKYAVEGVTGDQQKVRIIFAPCADEVTVVTVIDLGKEWACDCE